MEESKRYRNWLVTINNPSEKDKNELELICIQADKWVYQYERGEEAKTAEEHIHCYLHFKDPQRVQNIKRTLPRAHIDAINNNPSAAIAYVTKLETRTKGPFSNFNFKDGSQIPQQGRRNDIIKVREAIKAGKSLKSIADNDEYLETLQRGFTFWRWYEFQFKLDKSTYFRDLQVNYWWGTPGSGKTFSAISLFGSNDEERSNVFIAQRDNAMWWDGYAGQKAVIFDDWDDTWTTLSRTKRLLDRYPLNLEIKGGYYPALYTCVIITSNLNPLEAYPRCREDDRLAFQRRIHNVLHVTEKHENMTTSPFSALEWDGKIINYSKLSTSNCDCNSYNFHNWHEVAYNTKGNPVTKVRKLEEEEKISEEINLDINDAVSLNESIDKDFV